MNNTESRSSIMKGITALVETLSAGYNLAVKRIWLIFIPMALDIYLWLGPRLSIRPLTGFLLKLWLPSEQIPAELQSFLDLNRQFLETMGQEVNLFSLLSSNLMGMPSYLTGGVPEGITASSITWGESGSVLVVLALIPLLLAAGLFLGSIYLGAIAQVTRSGTVNLNHLIRRVWRYWLLILLFGVLLIVVFSIVGLPVFMLVALLEIFSSTVARFVLLGAGGLLMWALFHLFFVPHAIVIGESNLLPAVWNSMIVVGRNFWSTLGLIILMNLIQSGFTVIWDNLSVNAPLTALSIAGNAFIGTGLAAASLVFYRDRLAQWQAWLEQVQAAQTANEEQE